MKNINFLLYGLLLLVLAACGSSKGVGLNQVDDDAYWSKKDEAKTGTSYKDVEKWNKSKGPNTEAQENQYKPAYSTNSTQSTYQTPSTSSTNSSSTNAEDARAAAAYQAWQAQRGLTNTAPSTSSNNVLLDEKEEDRDARRFGSDRQYYYDDPYYNSLSSNWGWTSLYTPIYSPGFYNWAPGWNVGLSWNNRSGINWGFGYGFGNMGWNSGFGYSPYGYSPYYGYGYSPFSSFGYSPFYGFGYSPFYGYSPYYGYGYMNSFYNPWCYGGHNNYYSNGNDIVSNRPMMRPRNSMGSSVPAAGNRPGSPNALYAQPTRPGNSNPSAQANNGGQSTYVRPGNSGVGSNRPGNATAPSTNRPGGDLYYDNSGKPVYVSPTRNRPSNTASNTIRTYSNRPGGELTTDNMGRTVYVPARPQTASNYQSGSNTYQGNNSRPATYEAPRSSDNNSTPRSRGGSSSYNESRSSGSSSTPRSRGGSSSYNGGSSSSGNSQPSQSRPSYNAPSSRPSSSGGGGGGSSHSSGSSSAPRSRPR